MLHSNWIRVGCLLFAGIAGLCNAQSAFQPFAWKNVNLQGMGYVTSLVIHPKPPYDVYVGTDVGGAYRFDRRTNRWIPLTDFAASGAGGSINIEAIAVDPSDANTVYLAMPYVPKLTSSTAGWPGEVVVSHDRGATWAPTGLAGQNIAMSPNSGILAGMIQPRMAVGNGRVFYATHSQGIWVRDANGWRRVTGGLPDTAPEPGYCFVVLDPTRPTRVYAGVTGSGVWRSDDNGETWSKILDAPNPVRGAITPDGVLFATFGSVGAGAVRRFDGSNWTDITPNGQSKQFWAGISTDATAPGTILAAVSGQYLAYRSTDYGATWNQLPAAKAHGNQPPYYVQAKASNFYEPTGGWGNAGLAIDPANPRQAWMTNGDGVLCNDDVTSRQPSWRWVMNNLEELVVQRVVAPPVQGGADLLLVAMDMVGLRLDSRDKLPQSTFVDFPWVGQGDSIAYASQAPQNMAFVGYNQPSNGTVGFTGISSDNGRTWRPFPDTTPGVAGNIAISANNPQNMVWSPWGANSVVWFTRDGGATWKKARTPNGDLKASWQLSHPDWAGGVLAGDAVSDGVFYYYGGTTPGGSTAQGQIWSSLDGGETWTLRSTTTTAMAGRSPSFTPVVNLVPHPLRAGELWLAHDRALNQDGHFQLLRSEDGGQTWKAVPGLTECRLVAFGQGASAATPTVYIVGTAKGDTGEAVYKSEDDGNTWIRISDPARLGLLGVSVIAADLRVRDLVYVGVGGRGVFYGAGPNSGLSMPRVDAVADAASYDANGIAPGEVVVLFGSNIQGDVYFDGVPAPPIYATPSQTAVIAPFGLANRATTAVQVMTADGALSLPVYVPVVAAKPGIFTINAQGTGQALVIASSTGQLNGSDTPFNRDSDAFLYVSGGGVTSPAGVDGLPVDPSALPQLVGSVYVEVGGVRVPAQYAGGAPGFLQGLAQVNFHIPPDAPSGPAVPIAVIVGQARSGGSPTINLQ